MIKSLLAASIALGTLAVGSVISAPNAHAAGCSHTSTGWTICSRDNGRMGIDRIGMVGPQGQEGGMSILCTGNGGNRWQARGNSGMTRSHYQSMANHWCANY